MCGMEGEHMAATRLGSLAHVYESGRNQTRKRMPAGSLASLRCTSGCLDVRVFFCKVAAVFHFSTFICPRCGLWGAALVHRSYRCMLTSSRALPPLPSRRVWPRPPHQTQPPIPDECITPVRKEWTHCFLMCSQWVQVFVSDLQYNWS